MYKIGNIIKGKLSGNINGSAYLTSDLSSRDIYINKSNLNKAFHLDIVEVEITKNNEKGTEGRVINILERFRTEFVGSIQISQKHAFFIPDSNKLPDFFIPLSKINNAKNGQKVIAKFTAWNENSKNPNGEIIRILGNAGEHETEIHSILEDFSLPYTFPDEVIEESEEISMLIPQSEIDKRRDMREINTIGIDPFDSKDADDTLSIEWIDGIAHVSINIADVSHYVKPNSELDKEAYNRGNSVYLVDRCIPMLPERLSNGVCSLKSGSDKLSFTATFKIQNGRVIDRWFGKTIINVNKDYSYEEAQEVIEHGVREEHKKTDMVVLELNKIAKQLRKERERNTFLTLDKQEIKFKLDSNNKPIEVYFKETKDSNKLIEEFMLLANKEVANFIKFNNYPCVNRVHEEPNIEKLEQVKNFVEKFGYNLSITEGDEMKKSLNKLLIDAKDSPEYDIISTLVTRAQQKAYYSTKNLGHYGLGFKDYSHFTSPIRRYSDLQTHRILTSCLEKTQPLKSNQIEKICLHISETEKKAQKAERQSIKYMQCIYMSDKIGSAYKGIISSISEYGIFVELIDNHCEGMIKLSEINGDTFIADVNNHCVNGFNTGRSIRLGDEIYVVLKSVDIEKKNINLSLLL